MWFKKKSELQREGHYNTEKSADGTDWRTTDKDQTWSVSWTLPSVADANNYFYLPALGIYVTGRLLYVGDSGYYWSSSARPGYSSMAYHLYFDRLGVNVNTYSRFGGFRVDGFK